MKGIAIFVAGLVVGVVYADAVNRALKAEGR